MGWVKVFKLSRSQLRNFAVADATIIRRKQRHLPICTRNCVKDWLYALLNSHFPKLWMASLSPSPTVRNLGVAPCIALQHPQSLHPSPSYRILKSGFITLQPNVRHHLCAPPAAAGDDDMELAVFRFTLGIPGFDDALIPRVVGILGGALLLLNHIMSVQPVSGAQTRVEVLGAALAAIAIASPSLQRRLDELKPGRGRQAPAAQVDGGTNVFAIADQLGEGAQRDLAWASYAILRNANACGVFVVHQGRVQMCRGVLGSEVDAQTPGETLKKATQAWQCIQPKSGYFEDRGQLVRQSFRECALLPSGTGSVFVVPLAPLGGGNAGDGGSFLVLVSERERSLSRKEQLWAQGVAARVEAALRNEGA